MNFTEAGLKQALAPRPVNFFEQVGSTNDVGLEWLSTGAADGAVIVADEQTKGRGRLGRSWYAPSGTALMFTYLLRPSQDVLSRVGMLGALAVCETVGQLGAPEVGIKWPNDVQIEGRKVCGVLPEARWDGNRLVGVALGVGVNVSIQFEDSPFALTATSLVTALGKPVDRVELLSRVLARLDFWRERLDSADLFQAWRGRLNMLQTPITVSNGVRPVQGTAEDVDAEGALLVREENGALQRVMAGDIALG
jgi:BirA family biotin operon repressor/biotin-[acetyl-CoA-carboxylase] ligase